MWARREVEAWPEGCFAQAVASEILLDTRRILDFEGRASWLVSAGRDGEKVARGIASSPLLSGLPLQSLHVFFADERLQGALTDKLKSITDEAKTIYNGVAVTYASTMPAMGIMGSHFTDAGTVIRVGEYGTQRDAGRMIGEMHKVLGKDERLIVFITLDDLTCNFDGNGYLNFCCNCHLFHSVPHRYFTKYMI